MQVPAVRLWSWDSIAWSGGAVDLEALHAFFNRQRPQVLLVQHHPGFLRDESFVAVVECAKQYEVSVVVELHNARQVLESGASRILDQRDVAYVVHSEEEASRLAARGLDRVIQLHHPVQEYSGDRKSARAEIVFHPRIGSFGFLRPHKGVKKAIQVIAALKARFPKIGYVGYHALSDTADSLTYYQECLAEAERLGVAESIKIHTEFLESSDVMDALASMDLILLPYEPSTEGASGSANVAVAATRPIVVSSSKIFAPLRDVVAVVHPNTVDAYCEVVGRLCSDTQLQSEMAKGAREWASKHSYSAAARMLTDRLGPSFGA